MFLGAMAEVLGQELTEARLALLLEDLDDLPFEMVKAGIAKARKTCKFIPTPAELRDLARRQPPPPLGPPLKQIAAERARVVDSWKGGPPVPTLQEMVDSCFQNAAIAEMQIKATKDRLSRAYDAKEERELKQQLTRHQSDYEHWSGYVAHYRARVAKEGSEVVPTVSLPTRRAS